MISLHLWRSFIFIDFIGQLNRDVIEQYQISSKYDGQGRKKHRIRKLFLSTKPPNVMPAKINDSTVFSSFLPHKDLKPEGDFYKRKLN